MSKENNDIRVEVNPTFITAQKTLYMLAATGNKEAASYISIMGVPDGMKESSERSHKAFLEAGIPEETLSLVLPAFNLPIEARYEAVSRELKEAGSKNMLDIACGYTPRALYCHSKGIDYVGADLPVVVESMNGIAQKLDIVGKHPVYQSADATNAASLKAAASALGENLFVCTEGLLQYLSFSELEQLIDAVRQVLLEHGGAWYCSDMEVKYNAFAVTVLGKDSFELIENMRRGAFKGTDITAESESAKFDSLESELKFFEERGMRVERVPFYTEDTILNSMAVLPAEKHQALKELMKSFYVWKITPTSDSTKAVKSSSEVNNLKISCHLRDTVMTIEPEGRIDTLSAPELLDSYRKIASDNTVKSIIVDAKKIEYISSAGLRVLLIMKKENKEVKVVNASENVKAIFDTSGFDTVLDVE